MTLASLICCMATCAACTPVCFLEGTVVDTPNGEVLIQDLKAGDEVTAVDPRTGVRSLAVVSRIHSATVSEYLLVTTSSGVEISVTEHHPLWSVDQSQYREVGRLKPGDAILAWTEGTATAVTVASIERRRRKVKVFHLSVDRAPHTFLANGVIAHNKLPPVDDVEVSLVAVPSEGGWISVDHREDVHYGQGPDTLVFWERGRTVPLRAVPIPGWSFDRWFGDVADPDSAETLSRPAEIGARIECSFTASGDDLIVESLGRHEEAEYEPHDDRR